MIHKYNLTLDVNAEQALRIIAQRCRADGNMQGYAETKALAQKMRGANIKIDIKAADILCKICDSLRQQGYGDLVKHAESVVQSIKQGKHEQIVGSFLSGPQARQIIEKAGESGAKIIALEDLEGDNIPIANLRNGV